MSFRTKVNGVQIFGNNEFYPEWLNFIKSKGIKIDKDGCYDGEITDFMGALKCIEEIVMRLEKERQIEIEELKKKEKDNSSNQDYYDECLHKPTSRFYKTSLFDFYPIYAETSDALKSNDKYEMSLFDQLLEIIETGYIFFPYQFYIACKDILVKSHVFSTEKHFYCFEVKSGKSIHVSCH